MIIYISGPYTSDPLNNTNKAIDIAEKIANAGHTVFIPHLSHFWNERHEHDYDFWMEQDLAWLALCDLVIRIPGESRGADIEEDFSSRHGIPLIIYHEEVKHLHFMGTTIY